MPHGEAYPKTQIDEVMWIQGIQKDLHISFEEPIQVLCDYKSAISIAHDPVYHYRINHVDIDHFYIKEKLEEKVICIIHVTSTEECLTYSHGDFRLRFL